MFQEKIGENKWYETDTAMANRSFYSSIVRDPTHWKNNFQSLVENSMRKSDFVKWIWIQLNGQKKEEDAIDAIMDDTLPGKYVKEIKMQVPYINWWSRDFGQADSIRGTTFVPKLGDSIKCKAELIESDYIDCLDIWMKRNSLREGDNLKQVFPMIKLVYADVPQGVHKDQDKDAKGKLRKEDDHEEDPKKVCTVYLIPVLNACFICQ